MNSADQGVFPMDTAFKRRWYFEYLDINHEDVKIKDTRVNLKGELISWNKLRQSINNELISYNINEDKLIGPFFAFKEFKNQKILEKTFCEIFENKIIMYLFEDVAKSRRKDLFENVGKKGQNITYSQICNEFKEKGIGIFCDNIKNDDLKYSGE